MLKIENLSYQTNKKTILDNINLELTDGQIISIIGPNGSGKTTLLKSIAKNLKYKGSINEDKNSITTYITDKQEFISDIVYDNISFNLESLNYSQDEIDEKIKKISIIFGIEEILYENIYRLNSYQKTIVYIVSEIINTPNIILFDNALIKLDNIEQNNIFKMIRKYIIKNNILLINTSNRADDLLFSDKIIIINEGKIEMYDETMKVLENEKLFTKLGLELPFLIDLSIKLKYYNLLDKIYYNAKEMVNEIWK